MLVSCLPYSSTMKMVAICFSKMLVHFKWNIWHYIPEDNTLDEFTWYATKVMVTHFKTQKLNMAKAYNLLWLHILMHITVCTAILTMLRNNISFLQLDMPI
jgi:hypothetical protein